MNNKEKLKNLINNEIIGDLEEAIDEIFQMIEKEKMISIADRQELEELQEMHAECREILIEIESGEMDDDEAKELLEELIDIKSEK